MNCIYTWNGRIVVPLELECREQFDCDGSGSFVFCPYCGNTVEWLNIYEEEKRSSRG